ncbi:DUF6123 family protein [Heyndrickxia acidiproducens]|uniref:DUF6123 family protein n=1 Tax=Heyndrickxia acidiproducens TaxID=1121084 RepID=UPI00035FA426|nr:DUF6123 family protein [Heyndrickxia acidiproducens]
MSLGEYILFLRGKGFKFKDDVIHFIYFGKQYTNAPDPIVQAAIELTLQAQKKFDGSFYISLLETFKQNQIRSRKEAFLCMERLGIPEKSGEPGA